MDTERTRCLIVGSGPAGYTAAIYAARANLAPVLYEGMEPGGQLTTTTKIENFPGFPDGILGAELMEAMKKQAQQLGVDIRFGIATGVDFSSSPRRVTIDGRKIVETDAVIIATGAQAKYLGLESETLFKGQGVSACATCDGFFYRNQDVIVVGGGDSACEEATYLASICNKVYMVVRKDHLRASKAMQRRVMETPNIEIKFGYNTVQVLGDQNGVTGALVRHSGGEELELSFEDAARKILFDPKGSVPIGAGTYKALACPNPFSVCFVKAEYHKKLNAIRLLDVIQVVDVGTPINRLTVAGQLEGGIAQGVGYALYERMEINPRSRRTLSTDFLHYRIPQMGDMPRTYVDMVNSHDPYGPHGAKSVGELATVPVAPAIVNAVRRASGIEINSLPLCDKFAILPTERGNVK